MHAHNITSPPVLNAALKPYIAVQTRSKHTHTHTVSGIGSLQQEQQTLCEYNSAFVSKYSWFCGKVSSEKVQFSAGGFREVQGAANAWMGNEKLKIDSNLSAHITLATSCNHCLVPQCLLYSDYSSVGRWIEVLLELPLLTCVCVCACRWLRACASPFIHATWAVRPQHRRPVPSDC